MKYCLQCSNKLNDSVIVCPRCGFNYAEFMGTYTINIPTPEKKRRGITPIFSEEECLIYGIHPDDETYRKVMELNILSKNYR